MYGSYSVRYNLYNRNIPRDYHALYAFSAAIRPQLFLVHIPSLDHAKHPKCNRFQTASEVLKQRRKGQTHRPIFLFLRLNHSKGIVWAREETVEVEEEEDRTRSPVDLTDLCQLWCCYVGRTKGTSAYQAFSRFPQMLVFVLFLPDYYS